MKKANLYRGCKILVEAGEKGTDCYTSKEMNITRSAEAFEKDVNNDIWEKVTLLEDNLNLYHCEILLPGRPVSILYDKRKRWKKGDFDYCRFYTKAEIKKLLEDNYCVAVEGLQEIDERDLDKLVE